MTRFALLLAASCLLPLSGAAAAPASVERAPSAPRDDDRSSTLIAASPNAVRAASQSAGALVPAATAMQDGKTWDVSAHHGPGREVPIDTREGTWMSLDVSPDGREISFDLLGDIYVIPIGGGEARALTSGNAWDMQPRYSPNGKEIAFTSDRGGGDNIWVMGRDGSNPRPVTDEKFRLLNQPAWTPDGAFIVARKHYSQTRSLGAGEMWLYHRLGGTSVRPKSGRQRKMQII